MVSAQENNTIIALGLIVIIVFIGLIDKGNNDAIVAFWCGIIHFTRDLHAFC